MKRTMIALVLVCLSALAIFAIDPAAQSLIDGGHWKKLHYMAETRLKANPNDAEADFILAYAKFSFNDLDAAIDLAKKAVALDGNNADYHFLLARSIGQKASNVGILKGMGMAGDFKKENAAALNVNPNHIEALLDLMDYFYEAPGIVGGDKKKAYETADRIGKINASRGFLAQANLAGREKTKDWAKIEMLEKKAVEADPKSYDALITLGDFYASDQSKKYDEADALAHDALKLDPSRVGAYNLLAIVDVYRDRWQDLDAILAQAEKNIPDNLNPLYAAGRILYLTNKDFPRAERYFRKYLTQPTEGEAPRLSAAHWRLGLVLEKEGHKPEAIAEIETATKLEPDFEPAKKDLKRLK
jgi:tetratricopeptide (TPR) repeat protein